MSGLNNRIKLIVGLGNVGEQYHNTRHNAGFKLIDALAKKHDVEFKYKDFKGEYGILHLNDTKIILLKPHTYMNLSGISIAECMRYFKINSDEIIVLYDDKDLKVGDYKFKSVGSDGGHNGIKNIIQLLNTTTFKRVKIGIGPKPPVMNLADFVLGKFNKEETQKLALVINQITAHLKGVNVIEFSNLTNYKG